jgi:hypothetical protein
MLGRLKQHFKISSNNKLILMCFCFAILSMYPVYRSFYYSNGLLTYERHRAVIEKRSEFFNPWQYRILCPYLIEGALVVYNNTIDKIYPIEEKIHFNIESTSGTNKETDKFITLMQTKGVMKYLLLFSLFRCIEHLLIFYLCWRIWSYFVKSKWLLFFGINFLAVALGNAVAAADLTLNTYMDIIFYLATAHLILYNKSYRWLFLIVPLAALNRETGMLIPGLYFISQTDFTKWSLQNISIKNIKLPAVKTWLITIALYVIFVSIFIALKWYFGYQPQQLWKAQAGWPMFKLNTLSAVGVKSYFEIIGTFGVLPLLILYKFKYFPHILKKWFIFLVPVWFAVHYFSVVAYQTRIFMVPITLIFFPMILWLIEKEIKDRITTTTA